MLHLRSPELRAGRATQRVGASILGQSSNDPTGPASELMTIRRACAGAGGVTRARVEMPVRMLVSTDGGRLACVGGGSRSAGLWSDCMGIEDG